MSEIPTYDDAVVRYQDFLGWFGLPRQICWVFREDISLKHWGRAWVRVPVPSTNELLARELYDAGRRAGIGVLLDLFCVLSGRGSCCYVWVPDDEEDANRMLLRGLKLAVPDSPRAARPLGEGLLKAIVHRCRGRTQYDDALQEIPLRAGVEAMVGAQFGRTLNASDE